MAENLKELNEEELKVLEFLIRQGASEASLVQHCTGVLEIEDKLEELYLKGLTVRDRGFWRYVGGPISEFFTVKEEMV